MTSQNQSEFFQGIPNTGYGFSAIQVDELGASAYTLGTIIIDVSGSMSRYVDQVEKCLKEIIRACSSKRNPRADYMMLRVVLFNETLHEIHGFRPVVDCKESDYDGVVFASGGTALYDGTFNAMEAMNIYGKQLADQDFDVNCALFVVTDGVDNESSATADMCKDAIFGPVLSEDVESVMAVLIGVNIDQGSRTSKYLQTFKDRAGFQQYEEIDKADDKRLARLGNFVSQSFSSQSQSLGTGSASVNLTF